ncbi:MAG: hypothetical protein GY948_24710 [Alphaproteobacteria bacterium]|nr:hypothetical protein [Alphaproteobacteria bacterium]
MTCTPLDRKVPEISVGVNDWCWKVTEQPKIVPLRISEGQSTFLHIVKILAIAAVIIGHGSKPDILFDVDISLLGRATIPTFLMISGYFAAMTFSKAQIKGVSRGRKFLKSVMTRYFNMYFMFVPATLLVLAMDIWMVRVDAAFVHTDKFDPDLSFLRIVKEFWQLFTFSGEYWAPSTVGQGVFSNAAVWTMDYLMAYTVATAALYLLSGGPRVAVICLAVLIAGPTILLLSPLWWFGVFAFEIHRRSVVQENSNEGGETIGSYPVSKIAVRRLSLGLFASVAIAWLVVELSGVGPELYKWSKTLASYDLRQYLGMSKRFLWQWTYIPIIFTFLVTSKYIFTGPVPPGFRSWVQRVSKYCFPVFAFHFTTMYFFQALIPDYQATYKSADPYIMATSSLAVSIVCGVCCFKFVKPVTDGIYEKITSEGETK